MLEGAPRWQWQHTGSRHLFATSNELVRKPGPGGCVGGMAGTGHTLAKLVEEDEVVPVLTGLHGLGEQTVTAWDSRGPRRGEGHGLE